MGYEGATEEIVECEGTGLSFLACDCISSHAWCYLLLPREYRKITSNIVKQTKKRE